MRCADYTRYGITMGMQEYCFNQMMSIFQKLFRCGCEFVTNRMIAANKILSLKSELKYDINTCAREYVYFVFVSFKFISNL